MAWAKWWLDKLHHYIFTREWHVFLQHLVYKLTNCLWNGWWSVNPLSIRCFPRCLVFILCKYGSIFCKYQRRYNKLSTAISNFIVGFVPWGERHIQDMTMPGSESARLALKGLKHQLSSLASLAIKPFIHMVYFYQSCEIIMVCIKLERPVLHQQTTCAFICNLYLEV